jgi:two-component system chemotaxis sensor kinase CheA
VRVDRLDRLMNLAGELAVGRQTQIEHLEALRAIETLVARQQQSIQTLEHELGRLRFSAAQRNVLDDQLNAVLNTTEHMGKLVRSQRDHYERHTSEAQHLVEDLEREVMSVRLLPAGTLFANLPRAVREVANASGKEVSLEINGETTELDRKVIEALTDPLLHILRNAVDHGIEPPDEREQLGKPRQGQLEVSAQSSGAYAQIIIRDDGRGMDPSRLRQSAVRKHLLSAEAAERLSDQEALELIFLPGFSTAQLITDISGRGVGMDVVRTNVVEIGGQVQIDSRPGSGTTITLALPLTLVTTRVLLVAVGAHTFAMPATGCRATIWTFPEQVRMLEGRAVIPYEGRLAPLLRLADLLDVGGALPFTARHRVPTLIIGTAQRPLAVIIDRLIDEREAVVKPLNQLVAAQRRYSGAVQLGDGRLALMLNPAVLAQTATNMALAAPVLRAEQQTRRFQLLVADDSFTTRELIRSILQSAGYEVTTAVDGRDALDKLRSSPYDLIVSDVEMPHVDGFQLTTQIREEFGEASPPVIIVTSLASEAHRRRGLDVGAQAYIVKSQFNQGNLLETVQQLLGN